MSLYRNSLRILLVDTYPLQSRIQFKKNSITMASKLYKNCINRVLQKKYPNTQVLYNTIYPTEMDSKDINKIDSYNGSLWTGSSLNIDDSEKHHTINNQMKLIEHMFVKGIPSFGSCWALQLLSTMQGGICKEMDKPREFGFARKIELTEIGILTGCCLSVSV